jgi:ribosomal protein L11 methyltransferase
VKEFYKITLENHLSMEQAWQILEEEGIELAYGEEEGSQVILYLYSLSTKPLLKHTWIEKIEKVQLSPIDWDSQWALHGLNFKNGVVHFSLDILGRQGEPICLKPGPGFGDLSHPTTLLVLQLMEKYLTTQMVVDIGSGSGVLSLVAVALGASYAYGVDIDSSAIQHAQENAQLNKLESKCLFVLPEKFSFDSSMKPLILMNMISSEQKVAWKSLSCLQHCSGLRITSGVPKEERELYLEQTNEWGWKLKEEKELEGWMGFVFES